jgi:hypothetical protein
MNMGPGFFVIAILGCADGSAACTPVATMPTRYESRDACSAATGARWPPTAISISRPCSPNAARPRRPPPTARRAPAKAPAGAARVSHGRHRRRTDGP